MNYYILIPLIILSVGCGKMKHEASGSVSAETNHAVWISYKRMFDDWKEICADVYVKDSAQDLKCREDAMKRLTTMLQLDKNLTK